MYLVEGQQKYDRLKKLYPEYENKLSLVGFSKFDPIVALSKDDKSKIFQRYDIDPKKKTVLYAPTFFPSSIEKMADNFPLEFSQCNFLVKPHYLTYARERYKNQRKKLTIWSRYPNCKLIPVEEYDITPLLSIADIMISDESSAMFEFAALNKPVISNRFHKLRLSYYLMPWKLQHRIDVTKNLYRGMFYNAFNYNQTIAYAKEALQNPSIHAEKRLEYSKTICGEIDGDVSKRIYEALIRKLNV